LTGLTVLGFVPSVALSVFAVIVVALDWLLSLLVPVDMLLARVVAVLTSGFETVGVGCAVLLFPLLLLVVSVLVDFE